MKSRTYIGVGLIGLGLAATAPARADTLRDVIESGTLTVGVKADYRPYGYLDTDGNVVGIEPDLAQDAADVLGVDLELIEVVASNRMQFLEQGRIDVMIATMTDTMERRGVVEILNPDYYSSGDQYPGTQVERVLGLVGSRWCAGLWRAGRLLQPQDRRGVRRRYRGVHRHLRGAQRSAAGALCRFRL